ncbi:MAG: murein biosynthesis integral membrane protein MurJ [Simkaniaceae bacterium]|nr:murein biosynthesis integral membrane protein MurJ [Candidatus Sacchlamyda saccharinae]
MDTPQFVSRSALRFFSGTVLSKISGMLRDVAMAFYFGTSPSIAAFLLTFRFVYLSRRLFGESLLHQGFIPHFEEKKLADPKRAALFFRDLFWSMVFFLCCFVGITEGVLAFFGGETVHLARLMLPGVFFICLFGFCSGLLQSQKSFFTPSVAPVLSNTVWIIGILAFHHLPPSKAAIGLAVVLSFAFFVQWAFTIPKVYSYLKEQLKVREVFQIHLFSSEIRMLVKPLLLGMIGIASVQINSALDGVFARFASAEGPAYLWYAIRLQQLPLSLFAIALSSALLPSLSRAFEKGDTEQYFSLISFAKKKTIALLLPCTIGIFVLGLASINLLFGRGDFDAISTRETTLCLWFYGLGLLPMALSGIYAPAFYAKKDYKTPTTGFVLSTVSNLILNSLFVFYFKMGAVSIALATSLTAILHVWYLVRKLGMSRQRDTTLTRIAIAALFSGAVVLCFGYVVLGDSSLLLLSQKGLLFPRVAGVQVLHLFSQTALFFGLFFLFCRKQMRHLVFQRG